jgi:trimethylamine--corrinoid protein Co-methyltransferase
MNHLTGCLGKVGLAPFVGGNFDSLVFSPAMVVYSNEVMRQARIFTQGFDIDDDSVALNEIDAIGPGGNFLMADQTVALCREANFSNSIWPHLSLDQWQSEGYLQADKLLRAHTCKLLAELPRPEDHTDMIERGESFIRKKIP